MKLKSIGAVLAGLVFVIVVTTVVDVGLYAAGIYPPIGQPLTDPLAVLATGYRILIGMAGAYLTARLAPGAPMKHALVLGAIGFVLALVGVILTWDKGLGPHWYPIALVILAIPQSWLGAKLLAKR